MEKSCESRLETILRPFRVSKQQLLDLATIQGQELDLGLAKGPPNADVAMLPSFVPQLPDGTELGHYLGLDLGGTKLRVLCAELQPGQPLKMTSNVYAVTSEARTGTGDQLFDFVVDCLDDFLTKNGLRDEQLSLGFVFSFPCDQSSLTSAKLLWWTKDYTCTETLGQDVVLMLQQAIKRKDLKVRVRAIMNDTVGCLAAGAYENGPECLLGAVVSTGCNVSYLENVGKITKLKLDDRYVFQTMIIDTEWEEFGNSGQLKALETDIDKEIDVASTHVGKQTQDKYIAGLFMGETVRRILLEFLQDNEIKALEGFIGNLKQKDSLGPELVSLVLKDLEGNFVETKKALLQLNLPNAPETICTVVWRVCEVVSRRSSGVLAAGLTALLRHINVPKLKIGLGGSLYRNHPIYQNLLEEWMKKMTPENIQWELVTVEDGSGKGAALVAAVAEKLDLE